MQTGTCETQIYKKGQVIFREGDEAQCMYDIRWGSVGIYADYGTPGEKLLTTVRAEGYFGEMGLVEQEKRSATAVALEKDTRVEVITAQTFGRYLQERPGKVLAIMQQMSHRIRDLSRDYLEACGAVAEAVEAEDAGRPRKEGLSAKLKKFSDHYWSSVHSYVKNKEGV